MSYTLAQDGAEGDPAPSLTIREGNTTEIINTANKWDTHEHKPQDGPRETLPMLVFASGYCQQGAKRNPSEAKWAKWAILMTDVLTTQGCPLGGNPDIRLN